jgi:hypothetical protein
MRLFGTPQTPEEDRCEKTCFYASFLAVLHKCGNLSRSSLRSRREQR